MMTVQLDIKKLVLDASPICLIPRRHGRCLPCVICSIIPALLGGFSMLNNYKLPRVGRWGRPGSVYRRPATAGMHLGLLYSRALSGDDALCNCPQNLLQSNQKLPFCFNVLWLRFTTRHSLIRRCVRPVSRPNHGMYWRRILPVLDRFRAHSPLDTCTPFAHVALWWNPQVSSSHV
jgi:hypothetical protein